MADDFDLDNAVENSSDDNDVENDLLDDMYNFEIRNIG